VRNMDEVIVRNAKEWEEKIEFWKWIEEDEK
jgi:hypothetical protein